MIIYPAIDVMGGEVVRLEEGDFARKTSYGTDPAAVARDYADAGADWLHLVDLDGARDPAKRQTALVGRIIERAGIKVQTGGGIRGAGEVAALLGSGAQRVVIGSLAVREPDLVRDIMSDQGAESICLAADVTRQDGEFRIAVGGWQEASRLSLWEFIEGFTASGLRHVLCTDISRDGMMSGLNGALYAQIMKRFPQIELQASGGVSAMGDLEGLGTHGVIIGRAIYEGAIDLGAALRRFGRAQSERDGSAQPC